MSTNDILPGMSFPEDGRHVYHESWTYEQEAKARAMASRIMDIMSAGIQSGGDVVAGADGSVTVSETVAYDDEGRRIYIPAGTAFTIPLSGTFSLVIRHKFDSTPGHEPDMHGTIVEHRADSFEIVVRDGALQSGDVALRVVTNSGGAVSLGADLRVKRNLSVAGDTTIGGNVNLIGNLSKILDNPLWTETNSAASARAVKALITAAVNNLLDGAPGALDTLNELAAALGDNANYAATVTTALAARYTKSEIDAFFEVTSSGKKQVDWDRVTSKPDTATRWPSFGEVTGKPDTYPPSDHMHTTLGVANPPSPLQPGQESIWLHRAGNLLYWDNGDGGGWRPFA